MTEREALAAWAIKARASGRVWTSAEVWAAAWQASRKQALEEAAQECDGVYYRNIGPDHGEVRYGIAAAAAAIRSLSQPTGGKE